MTGSDLDKKLRVVIVGAGIAGVSAAEAAHSAAPETDITLISEEKNPPYFRMNLTRYLAGELDRTRLDLHKVEWYLQNHINLILDRTVTAINPAEHTVATSGGEVIPYDKLILTAGATPFVPAFAGKDKPGVQTVRTLDDTDYILSASRDHADVVCIGGGLLGLETAGAIAARGAKVTVVEALDWLLPRQLDRTGSLILQDNIQEMGIKVIVPGKTKEIVGEGKVSGVLLEDGTLLPATLVVVSAGIAPNLGLAKAAGIEVKRGILVSDHMETSAADIFAAGDIAEHHSRVYGLWAPAKSMGTVAGKAAVGKKATFPGDPPSAKLKVLSIDMFSIGQFAPSEPSDLLVAKARDGNYACFVFRGGLMIGAVLLGDASWSAEVKQAVEEKRDFSAEFEGKPSVQRIKRVLTGS